MSKIFEKYWVLALLSAFLLSLPWILGAAGIIWIFAGLTPLLVLQKRMTDAGQKGFLWWALGVFAAWIMATCWWVSVSTIVALFAVPIVGLAFIFAPFALWHRFFKGAPEHLRWVALITIWITAEAAYTYGEISFPWLTLGNAFWDTPILVQWYEFTGTFGGSLWVLIANILLFKIATTSSCVKYSIALGVVLTVPIITSMTMYYSYKETKNPIRFSIVQPNIDPYNEKFGGMSSDQQRDLMLTLASEAPAGTNFIILPETAWPNGVNLDQLEMLDTVHGFLRTHNPGATLITGATTLRILKPAEPSEPYTQIYDGGRINVYNSALWLDTTSHINVYHKSKLVCGVELLPYPLFFGFLSNVMSIDLGGYSGHLGTQAKRETFDGVGTAICYEAIYGEFFTQYVRAGAEVMVVISNDGWWGETAGHKHLLGFSRLRAIETRRSIARSANTGISALINQRGDITERLGWDVRGVMNGTLNGSNEQTFYVRSGDYITRLALYIMGLCVLYLIAWRFRQKQ